MDFFSKFYPKKTLKNILEISLSFLDENKIKALILDVDNTLISYDKKMIDGLENWINTLKSEGIKFCILSNSNNKKKVEQVANVLKIPYIFFGKKPFKINFKKAKELLKEDNENIAVVGDQVMTDVFGANRSNMYSILVEPIGEKDIIVTRLNRLIAKRILKRYYSKEKIDRKVK